MSRRPRAALTSLAAAALARVAPAAVPRVWRENRLHAEDLRRTQQILERILAARSCTVGIGDVDLLETIVRLAPFGRQFAFASDLVQARSLAERFPDVDVRRVVLRSTPSADVTDGARSSLDLELDEQQPLRLVAIAPSVDALDVLRGARRTLARWKPYVLFRLPSERGAAGLLFALLAGEHGMAVSSEAGWLAGDPPLTLEGLERAAGEAPRFLAHPPRGG